MKKMTAIIGVLIVAKRKLYRINAWAKAALTECMLLCVKFVNSKII